MTSIAEVDLGTPRARGIGSEVRIVRISKEEDIPARCASALGKLVAGTGAVPRNEVAVLAAGGVPIDDLVVTLSSAGVRAEALSKRALSGRRRDCVLVASAADFKGLERPVVLVAGLGDPEDEAGFKRSAYAAFSRANHTLHVICTDKQADLLARLQVERHQGREEEQE
jgi:hypothetical protein